MSATYPNLRHLRLFCTYLQVGSVSDAAEICGVSQPAATQALTRLDQIFGARLIDRQRRATPEGQIVLMRAERTLYVIRTGCKRLQPARQATEVCNHVTIPHLRALAAFGEAESFSAAARLLRQSEPAVHRTARDAEAILKTPIFEGSGRNIRLTSNGLAVVRWSRLALNELDSAAAEMREARGQFDGRMSIGTLPLARTSVIPEAVAEVSRQYPQAQFEILEGSYAPMLSALESGRIDMIVGALREDVSSRTLVQETLFPFNLSVMAGADHPLSKVAGVTPNDLAKYPWIVAREDAPSRKLFMELAERAPLRQAVEVGSLVAIRGILMKTDHLALLSHHQCEFEINAGFLTKLDFELPPHDRSVGVTHRRHWIPTALQSSFLESLGKVALRVVG